MRIQSWNKGGNVPMLMIFIVAIVLVIAALMSFATFNRNFDEKSLDVSRAIAKVQFGEEYMLKYAREIAFNVVNESKGGDLKVSFVEVAKGFDKQVSDPANNFFGKIRNNEFSFESVEGAYRLKVDGLYVRAISGTNQITRNFDLCMLFDSSGGYIPAGFNEATEKEYALKCGQKGL